MKYYDDTSELVDDAFDYIKENKILQVGAIVVVSLVGLYLLTHIMSHGFNASAKLVRSYKNFHSALIE